MTARVAWTKAAYEAGFANYGNVFSLFTRVVGNEDVSVVSSSSDKIVLEGEIAFEGQLFDVRLTVSGTGLVYNGATVSAGTFKGFKFDLLPEGGGKPIKLLQMKKLAIDSQDFEAALTYEDLGGSESRVADLLYGKGWTYNAKQGTENIWDQEVFDHRGQELTRDGNDRLIGGRGDDRFHGGDGRDKLLGNRGNDTLQGGQGRDTIDGGKGRDEIYGDTTYWDGAADLLRGGKGNDTLAGGQGRDTVIGGKGNDMMYETEGRDTFVFRGNSGHDFISENNNDGVDLDIGTDATLTVTFLNKEGTFKTGPWKGEYFDRGYLIEWEGNSILLQTYADRSELGLEAYDVVFL